MKMDAVTIVLHKDLDMPSQNVSLRFCVKYLVRHNYPMGHVIRPSRLKGSETDRVTMTHDGETIPTFQPVSTN